MEHMVTCRRHTDGSGRGSGSHHNMLTGRQPMGTRRRGTVSVRDDSILCSLNGISCHATPQPMEGKAAPLGPCRHLLAHSGKLFAAHPRRLAPTGILGMESVLIRMAMRHSGHGGQLCTSQGTQQHRDRMFCGYGAFGACGFQTTYRQREHCRRGIDSGRRRVLHHRSTVLQPQQAAVHALRIPLLRTCRQYMPHHCRLGRAARLCPMRELPGNIKQTTL